MNYSSISKRAIAIAGAILLAGGPAAAIEVPVTGIEVTVINSDSSEGDGTCVSIYDAAGEWAVGSCDLAGGVYRYEGLEPGEYYVRSAWNYDELYNQFYDGVAMFADATPVTVVADEMTSIILQSVATPYLFSDVGTSHPFYHPIAILATHDIVGGYTDGTFRPGAAVTRQAFAAFAARLLTEVDEYVPAGQSFPDVPTDHPFYVEIEVMAEYGIAGGYSDGDFRPSAPMTRQAAAAFVNRIGKFLDDPIEGVDWFGGYTTGDGPEFSDVAETNPFYEEINWLAWTGTSDGYTDGTYRPSTTITRQAMASFLYRFFSVEGYFWDVTPEFLGGPASLDRDAEVSYSRSR